MAVSGNPTSKTVWWRYVPGVCHYYRQGSQNMFHMFRSIYPLYFDVKDTAVLEYSSIHIVLAGLLNLLLATVYEEHFYSGRTVALIDSDR